MGGNTDEALNNLIALFPSVDRVFLEDVYGSSNKDFDKTGIVYNSLVLMINLS
jgi:hypothetical protein